MISGQINTVEEQEMKFDHLEGILTKKYNGYSIEIEKTPYDRKLQIRGYGDLVNLKISVKKSLLGLKILSI